MSEYNHTDPIKLAEAAERDLNSYQAKQGLNNSSDSAIESGVNQAVENKFPGASVKYGSEASGAGDNRTIPEDEGGEILRNGQPTKARDFEGMGGPEDKAAVERLVRGGDDDVDSIVRQRQKKVGRRSDEDEDEDEESLSK